MTQPSPREAETEHKPLTGLHENNLTPEFTEADSRGDGGEVNGDSAVSSRASPRPPIKLYKIGEVMAHTGLSRQTIHNYTMLGLITEEARTPSGHRLYGESVFYRLERIADLKVRMSLKEVREVLERGEG